MQTFKHLSFEHGKGGTSGRMQYFLLNYCLKDLPEMGTPLFWEQWNHFGLNPGPLKPVAEVPLDGAKSQVSPTVRDRPCLETLNLTTLVLWQAGQETSPATRTQGKCSKRFLSIGLKHKQTKPKDVAHTTAQVPLSPFWNSSQAPRFLIEICKMPNSLLSLHCASGQKQRLLYVTAWYWQHTIRQIDADFI